MVFFFWSFGLLASIQARNDCSRAAQPAPACPEDAQHPNTEDMRPRQGFACIWFGRLTFNRGSGGSRGALILLTALEPGGLGTMA